MIMEPSNATLLPALLWFEPAPVAPLDPVGVGPEPVADALLLVGEPVETVVNPEEVAEPFLDELLIVSKTQQQ